MEEYNHFKFFIKSMNKVLTSNDEDDGRNQQSLLEDLFVLEHKFRDTLISIPEGKKVYTEFIRFIMEDKRNILSARIYFRERQALFSEKISICFKENKPHLLYKFHINYNFAKWVCDGYKGPKSKSLQYTLKKIIKIRKVLCENNMPLAINRAKIFWSKIPRSSAEYMDFIQDANEGLMSAIDKFVPPYKTVFRSVAVGRMSLNMLTDHNATLVKFSPTEKRVLYRARNAKVKEGLEDPEAVLKYVKQSFPNITIEKLQSIMSSATEATSMDQPVDSGSEDMTVGEVIPDNSPDPEAVFMNKELILKIMEKVKYMPIIEMKLIKMKFGVENG